MAFIRRFVALPTIDVIRQIEGVVIVDQTPQGVFTGTSTGKVAVVGEWVKGPFNFPIDAALSSIEDVLGGMSLSLSDPLSPTVNPFSNGCAFASINGKAYAGLVLVRANMDLVLGVNLRLDATGAVSTGSIQIPAGGGASLVDGETFTLPDGINTATIFEYDSGGGVVPGNIAIAFTALDTQATVATNTRTAINAVVGTLRITAAAPVAGLIALSNDIAGTHGNLTITDTVANVGFLVSGMSGGTGFYLLPEDVVVPAGTRVRNPAALTEEFALSADIVYAAGTDLSVSASTAFEPVINSTDPLPTYSTRTVAQVPVYSTQGNDETAVGDVTQVDATDLFRGGIGAGTALPLLGVTVDTDALDTATANADPLTALTSNEIDARYQIAIDATAPGEERTDDISILYSARHSETIRAAIASNVADSSAIGKGRVGLNSPPVGTLPAIAVSSSDPGVGVNRSDRVIYCYPHYEQNISALALLDPSAVISGPNILLAADSAAATVLSNLPPENNPGQSTQSIKAGGLMQFIRKLEDGLTGVSQPTRFKLANYIAFKAAGIMALVRDGSEWVFQSGVTSVDPEAYPTLVTVARRRMTDFLEDSMAQIALSYQKLPNTTTRFDSLVGDEVDFLELMLMRDAPEQQRIADYSVDSKSGNTLLLQGSGIRVIQFAIRELDTLDDIVLQVEAGPQVRVTAPG